MGGVCAARPPEPAVVPGRHGRWVPGVVQVVAGPGIVDLGPGYFDPELLPVDAVQAAQRAAMAEYGPAALSYGHNPGADPLRRAIAARATAAGGAPCGPEHVLVTSGTSMALYLLATVLAARGDVVLCDPVCYDLAQKLFTDCGLRLGRVAGDDAGMSPEELDAVLARARRDGSRVAFVYLNPTYQNPLGRTVPVSRRRELIAVAARHDVAVVEDDAYAEVNLDEGVPPSMAALAGYRGLILLGSFAKTLGPGLRLGWLLADPGLVQRLAGHGVFVSGGSLNHLTSLAVAMLLSSDSYDLHLASLRAGLSARRDALVGALDGVADFRRPAGGFFLWLRFPDGPAESALLAAAAAAGVRVAVGSRFGRSGTPSVRLSYSFNPPAVLRSAGQTLGAAWRSQ